MKFEIILSHRRQFIPVRIHNSVTLPPGDYTELSFVQMLDQLLNAASYGAIHAEYDSVNNVCGIYTYTTGNNTAFRLFTDEEVQKQFNNAGSTFNEILNNIITPSPTYSKDKPD